MGRGHKEEPRYGERTLRGAEVWGEDTERIRGMGRGHREELRYGERTQRGAEAWGEDTERS